MNSPQYLRAEGRLSMLTGFNERGTLAGLKE